MLADNEAYPAVTAIKNPGVHGDNPGVFCPIHGKRIIHVDKAQYRIPTFGRDGARYTVIQNHVDAGDPVVRYKAVIASAAQRRDYVLAYAHVGEALTCACIADHIHNAWPGQRYSTVGLTG